MKTLYDLFTPSENANDTVAWGPGGAYGRHAFRQRIADYRLHVSPHTAKRWGLFVEDVTEFACALFALLAEGREVTLLPHDKVGLLQALSADIDAWILSEAPDNLQGVYTPTDIRPPRDAEATDLAIDEASALYFYTSGSTGKGKSVRKSLKQLIDEVAVLEELWGPRAEGAVYFSTVSHQHIYGFLFRLLWPLMAQRPFWTQNLLFPNELQEHTQAHGKAVLVSCPAHLERMPDLFDLDVLRQHCETIFSSGGLLSESCAHRLESGWREPPLEVFGSTETGGVAYRQQHRGKKNVPWQPLPRMELRAEDEESPLFVRSPFVSNHPTDRDGWFAMGDKVRLHADGTFELRGRVDRIAKIEQKRVSLNEMESRLCENEHVEKCAVLIVPDEGDYCRTFLGSVLVLTDEGTKFCSDNSKLALTQLLKRHLLAYFERVTLPRRWLIVDTLPANAQGKCTEEDLLRLFSSRFDIDVRLPTVRSETVGDHALSLSCRVPESLCYFDGHFDEQPIVAGVVQMHWAMHYANKHFGIVTDVCSMHAVKFHNVMFPADEFTLDLNYDPSGKRIQFSLKNGDKAFSSGRLTLTS